MTGIVDDLSFNLAQSLCVALHVTSQLSISLLPNIFQHSLLVYHAALMLKTLNIYIYICIYMCAFMYIYRKVEHISTIYTPVDELDF